MSLQSVASCVAEKSAVIREAVLDVGMDDEDASCVEQLAHGPDTFAGATSPCASVLHRSLPQVLKHGEQKSGMPYRRHRISKPPVGVIGDLGL